ncbi:MAG: heterodisulfide reductase [bacterium]|nr:heterodisulfide reductase [bacterium]
MELQTPSRTFRRQIMDQFHHGERLSRCVQCGVCGGSCPNGPEMDHTPRELIALVLIGDADEVLRSNTPWKCVSCYFCTTRCPQQIPVTELMYTLKRRAFQEGLAHDEGADLARAFIHNVERYGRSFEFGLASRYYLTHKPANLLRMGPLGLSMARRGRISLHPTRIRELPQLQAIIQKAKEMEGGAS